MDNSPQKRALHTYRAKLAERGMARFEVLGRDTDRALIRSVARHLAKDGPEAVQLRQTISGVVDPASSEKGGIFRALRRSPLVGVELDLTRPRIAERDVDL
ncbi:MULTISPECIES: hypothetical protein [Methylobacterium]|uniref:Uncharacterized protein n=1 Tax=Methylobacterium thuringiense TaxID=1003091 RepID=A0ABQ4TM53_9HYPH|nr:MULTISPECIES: hypothetical protein [Methylobacterium]TXN20207.1 hypothetical protein FV217_18810 [Methylobacterium sp. WL9]GJE55944.1 hypothetical protein EKPJFOCH_2441 [Methylobacterium thuringiense]